MSPELLLGIDVGSYSTKGVLIDMEGTVLASSVVEHGIDFPRPGWAEHDADGVWWQDVVAISRSLLTGRFSGSDVAGVGISTVGPCVVPLDDRGRPLRKGILYGIDTRASKEVRDLTESLGEESLLEFSAMTFTSQAIGPKILWMRRNEPEVWSRARWLTSASGYIVYRLTGEHVIDRHTASHFMPLIDMATLEWSHRFSEQVAPLELLPSLVWTSEVAGTVTPAAARETGLRAGTPVNGGTIDVMADAVSAGVTAPGDLMVVYGSSTSFILILDEPKPDRRLWSAAGTSPGQYTLSAGMATSGSITRWIRDELARELPRESAYSELFAQAAEVPPGSHGLLVLPYFSGERTPRNDPNARGVIAGLSLSHGRAHLLRAALEGVAYGIRHNLETFEEVGAHVKRIVAVGGGTQGDTWTQIVSDVIKRRQEVPEFSQGACKGDAILAGLAAGMLELSDLAPWVGSTRTIEPNTEVTGVYDEYYPDFQELYEGTVQVVQRLAQSTSPRGRA